MSEDEDERKPEDRKATVWEHLLELSRRLRAILYSIFLITVAFMVIPGDPSVFLNPSLLLTSYKPLVVEVLDVIRAQILPGNVVLIGGELTSGIELYLIISVFFGVIFSTPVIAYEIYKYIDPALYPHEKGMIYPFTISFIGLFVGGALFGYFFLVKIMIEALVPFIYWVGAQPIIYVMDFYQLVLITVTLTGLSFTFPAVYVVLVRAGLTNTASLTRNRRYIYVILFIITALITPDGGPIADVILFVPIVVMMEIAIFIARRYERERLEEEMKNWPTCPYCGAKIPPDEVFCPKCGRSLQ